jgi:Ca2+-binding RTX toxin-like protein
VAAVTVEQLEPRRLFAAYGPDDFGYVAEPVPLQQGVALSDAEPEVILGFAEFVDDDYFTVDLGPNTFNFYGQSYTGADQLYVNSNGLITFGEGTSDYSNTSLADGPVTRAIAVLWDDWVGDAPQTQVKLDEANDRLIVQWTGMHYSSSPDTMQFQAILQLNTGDTAGDIVFNYPDLNTGDGTAEGATATVGVRAADVVPDPLEISFDDPENPLVGTGKAIKISLGVPGQPKASAGPSKSVEEGGAGLTFQLDGSASSDPDGQTITYAWDLDDDGLFGETGSDAEFGDETGIKPTFRLTGTLEGPRTYDITLKVTDTDNLSGYSSTFVEITGTKPVVDFDPPSDPRVLVPVEFTFTTDQPGGTFSYTVNWGDDTFGDFLSGPGSGTTGSHVFFDPGTYTITVTASDGETESDPVTREVEIGPRPDFSLLDGVLYVGGSSGNDTIAVALDGDENLKVTRNGAAARTFALAEFSRIDIETREGDDIITYAAEITFETGTDTGDGNDTLTGGDGPDWVWTGAGADVITTGAGDDRVTSDGDDTVTTGDGNDFVDATFGGMHKLISLGDGNDGIEVGYHHGSPSDPGQGATVDGGDGNDNIVGTFASLARGGAGDDAIGLLFADTIEAGDGNDIVRCMQPGDSTRGVVLFGNDGDDRLQTGGAADSIYGGAGRDTIHAGAGGDLLSGGGGNDHLFAQGGHDRLYGGAGDDRLEALGGNDRLTGGAGADLLHGGEGDNTAFAVNEDEDDLLDIQHTL